MNRTTPLTRKSPSRPQRKPLRSVSPQQGRANREKGKAYKVLKERVQWCESCGTRHDLTPSHALTEKQHKHQAANPANLFLLCVACHDCWENRKREFARMAPDVWARKLQIIKQLSPQQYALLAGKYPDLIPDLP